MISSIVSSVASKFYNFLIDSYWDFATSLPILGGLLLGAILLQIVAVVGFIPIQYRALAKPLAWLCAFFFVFNLGYRVSDRRAELAQERIDHAFTLVQLQTIKATEADKARIAKEASATVAAIQEKVKAYEARIAKLARNKACGVVLTRADSDELRAIGQGQAVIRPLSIIDRVRGVGRGG